MGISGSPTGDWVNLRPVNKDLQEARKIGLRFQVADVVNRLLSVNRLTEKGNRVVLEGKDGESFIMNKSTGECLLLRHNGRGSCLLKVQIVGGALLHSKKSGDGYVDNEAKLEKIFSGVAAALK